MKNVFTIIPQFLRNPQEFYRSVQNNEELRTKAFSLFISIVVFLMIYGFVIGLSFGLLQALSSAVKIPLLFLLTLAFTLPALYFFALALLNIQFSITQAGVVVLTGIGVTAFLLLGLSPVTLFFDLISSNYSFFQLMAVLYVGISGLIGLYYVLNGIKWVDKNHELTSGSVGNIILWMWVILYGFVGAQMTWSLSPLIGNPEEPFYLLRPSRDNFFVDVINAFQRAAGANGDDSSYLIVGVISCGGLILVLAAIIGVWLGSMRKVSKNDTLDQ